MPDTVSLWDLVLDFDLSDGAEAVKEKIVAALGAWDGDDPELQAELQQRSEHGEEFGLSLYP